MEKKILAPGIICYYNIVPDSIEFVNLINNKFGWEQGVAAPSRYLKKDGSKMERLVETFFVWEDDGRDSLELLAWKEKFLKDLSMAEKDYMDYYGVDTVSGDREWLQFLKYEQGGVFSSHIDDVPDAKRTLSGVYYFNEDYSGGELYFKHFNLEVKPEKNTYLVFPSNWPYAHEAKKITCGTKYAMVNFLT
jgi:hypothetical protein